MRMIAALLLIVAGALYSYWAFLATFVWDTGTPTQWVFVTAFGWLICYDLWHRFVAGDSRSGRRHTSRSAQLEPW
jgi:hypothetical protein